MSRKYKAIFDKTGLLAEFENDELTFLREDYEPPDRSDLAAPMVIKDIEAYKSMIDGSMITSRSTHRDHLRAHSCIEVGNEKMETKIQAPKKVDRRKVLHQQLADMSDRQANTILSQLRKGI